MVVILGVIPNVRDIWVPRTAGAGGSVPAFWASVFANLVFAGVMLGTVAGRRLQSRRWRWLVLILGAGAIVQALMYLDVSSAFNGPLEAAMQPTRDQLRYAIAADAGAGVLAILAAFTATRVWYFVGRAR